MNGRSYSLLATHGNYEKKFGPFIRHLSGRKTEKIASFNRARQGNFFQDAPQHQNPFTGDPFLQRCLKRMIDPDLYKTEVEPDLIRFGDRVVDEIWDLGRRCETEPPTLRSSPWGHDHNINTPPSDTLVTSTAWKRQKDISAEEGLIALAYSGTGTRCQYRRLHQIAKLYLYAPSSGMFSCPLAMTDGAAAILTNQVRNGSTDSQQYEKALSHLMSRDPRQFWTSGQWMTEKRGGSDVANGTQTFAVHTEGNRYKLFGYKWFSSATDSDMALTLARIVGDEEDTAVSGTSGISMFYLETHLDGKEGRKHPNHLNNVEIVKLKNKLGTKQLPTAELLLDGAEATLVSQPGRGIASIAPMLTVTRMHNVLASVSAQRKILQLARDYAKRRMAFGRSVCKHPLHMNTLMTLETSVRGCTILMLELARLMGLEEAGKASEQDAMVLRVMMPVAKAFTAKLAVANTSEGLECFGGQGYIEDTGLPSILRDAQVLPIWEGTTNIMALDVFRAIVKTEGLALDHLIARINGVISSHNDNSSKYIKVSMEKLSEGLTRLKSCCPDFTSLPEVQLRDFLFSLANLYIGALLIEHASHGGNFQSADAIIAHQWTTRSDLVPFATNQPFYVSDVKLMQDVVYEGYES